MSEFADAHRAFSTTFTDKVKGTADWNAPAPVEGWTAASIVEHLVTWLPGFLAAGSDLRLPPVPNAQQHPLTAWELQRDAVQSILDDPEKSARPFRSEGLPEMTVAEALNQFYSADVFMHTWDLARATGQGDRLDPNVAEAMLAGMEPMEEMLRASGQFGTGRGPLRDDADATDKLISFLGRDPYWHPND